MRKEGEEYYYLLVTEMGGLPHAQHFDYDI